MRSYRIAGLTVVAEFELPGAIEAALAEQADISIRYRPVPDELTNPTVRGAIWELNERCFLLRLPGIGRILAEDGKNLDFDTEPGVDPADMLIFVLGTGLGALLYQRGAVVLHASAVALDGRAYAFCGPSGIGKSTLAAALCRDGCEFVSDDISVITLGQHGEPVVCPDGRQLKLFEESIAATELADCRRGKVRSVLNKHYVDPPALSAFRPTTLAGVYILSEDRFDSTIRTERLSRLAGAQALLNQSYRPRLALAMAHKSDQVKTTAAILRHAFISRMSRPEDLHRLDNIANHLRSEWSTALATPDDVLLP